RLAHGVAAGPGFPNRLAHCVADVARASFPDWFAHGVLACASFPHRLADGVANFLRARFGDVLDAVNNPIFADSIPARLVACYFLPLVLYAANRFHHRVTPHLAARRTTAIPRDSAEPGFRFCWDKR